MAKPLTELLKKYQFIWTPLGDKAFQALKCAHTKAPVLALPDFSKLFVVKTDASLYGIGTVLMYEGHPLAFISRTLGPNWQQLSVY